MSLLPPRDPRDFDLDDPTSVKLPKWIRKRLKEIAEAGHYSQAEVITFFLKWALSEHDRQEAEAKKGKK